MLIALRSIPSTRNVPVLILSNSSRDEDKHRAAELGAAGYYVKANLSLKKLGAEIVRLIEARTPDAGEPVLENRRVT